MGTSVTISAATDQDAEQILKLQYLCYQPEAALYDDYGIEPLTQSLAGLREELATGCVVVARLGDEVVGSARGTVDTDGTARIGKLIVHPRLQRHGLGGRLLAAVEARLSAERAATRYRLLAGHRGDGGLRLYRNHGYAPVPTEETGRRLGRITLEKPAAAQAYATGA
ncbi:GNAT family N-acetyltransferase [Streptomyces sp. NBC_01525]|uniref:GNAT family N-acetyltransferase n=1 Tax=Streptomyces benahoarensis TaxID=2595054 RepID=A0A553YZ47_9ACTN|nr:GNAT family N-acetyltransferase [Streptomyces benahoarensis]TSB21383.1 GNAT family N-acetyltransferase [Streptomyces benahoarensis]TSB34506.1 GNAT family N-acetyltransferase [Streptomyces benahoarensis]